MKQYIISAERACTVRIEYVVTAENERDAIYKLNADDGVEEIDHEVISDHDLIRITNCRESFYQGA